MRSRRTTGPTTFRVTPTLSIFPLSSPKTSQHEGPPSDVQPITCTGMRGLSLVIPSEPTLLMRFHTFKAGTSPTWCSNSPHVCGGSLSLRVKGYVDKLRLTHLNLQMRIVTPPRKIHKHRMPLKSSLDNCFRGPTRRSSFTTARVRPTNYRDDSKDPHVKTHH